MAGAGDTAGTRNLAGWKRSTTSKTQARGLVPGFSIICLVAATCSLGLNLSLSKAAATMPSIAEGANSGEKTRKGGTMAEIVNYNMAISFAKYEEESVWNRFLHISPDLSRMGSGEDSGPRRTLHRTRKSGMKHKNAREAVLSHSMAMGMGMVGTAMMTIIRCGITGREYE